jgi:hypothetical protein
MILLHGLFDLKDGVAEQEFRRCFDLFAEHMAATNGVQHSRFMRHEPHDGYNSDPPATKYYVAMEFPDMECAERCWTCIEKADEPTRSLHADVFSRIQDYRFFLTSDVQEES